MTGTPREVLARIVSGDPLGVRTLVLAAAERRAVLVDTDRAVLRALARIAREADRWRGRPSLTSWLEERVDEALDDVLHEAPPDNSERSSSDSPRFEAPAAGPFELLAPPLGLDPDRMRSAARRFNRLAGEVREAFFLLLVKGAPLSRAAQTLGVSEDEAARLARRALSLFDEPVPAPPPCIEEV